MHPRRYLASSSTAREPRVLPRPSQKPGNGIFAAKKKSENAVGAGFAISQRLQRPHSCPRNGCNKERYLRRPENLSWRENGWWAHKDSNLDPLIKS